MSCAACATVLRREKSGAEQSQGFGPTAGIDYAAPLTTISMARARQCSGAGTVARNDMMLRHRGEPKIVVVLIFKLSAEEACGAICRC